VHLKPNLPAYGHAVLLDLVQCLELEPFIDGVSIWIFLLTMGLGPGDVSAAHCLTINTYPSFSRATQTLLREIFERHVLVFRPISRADGNC
jgi:hypothetical protein